MVIVHIDADDRHHELTARDIAAPHRLVESLADLLQTLQAPQQDLIEAVVLDVSATPAQDCAGAAPVSNQIAVLRSAAPDAAIVALVAPGDAATARQALDAGAARCVEKNSCYPATLSGLLDGLSHARRQIDAALDAMTAAWATQLSRRNNEREDHLQRVTSLTLRVAQTMGISADELRYIRYGALLHDLGKLAVPESILAKPGPLTDDEWRIVLTHPEHARQMLSAVPHLSRAIDIPYAHHERWDGTGYPRGLRGEQIPLAARIFAVVDVWDTLCSDRPYRKRWSPERVREHIRALAGTSFDPAVVDAFLAVLDQLD